MNSIVYNRKYFETTRYDEDDDTFGIVGALIAAGPSIFSTVAGLFGGGRKAQCQGLQEIQNCGQQAVQAMNQLLASVTAGAIDPQQAVNEASRIVTQFNDPSIVYPAKKGKDATARQQFIEQLAGLQQQVQQAAAARTAANQQSLQSSSGGGVFGGLGGISGSTLVVVGGGLLAVLLLTRRD
jgi:hypothetical protein